MSTHTSWSQMEQGELISYETNLVACYEAEYLLSLQYKTDCQCTDPHSASTHTEIMEYNSCQNAIENDMKLRENANVVMEGDNVVVNFSTRKRPHHDANHISCKTNINVKEQPKDGSNSWYNYREQDNNLVYTGQLSPHVKRMCFEAQQCQS